MSIQENGSLAPSVSSSRCFLIATINGRYLAFEAESVTGVATVKELEHGDDPKIHGAVEFPMQLNRPDIQTDPNTPVVLLADRGTVCRIRVSRVHGRLDIEPSQILPIPAQFGNVERQWYRGMILLEKSVAFILNPTWIFEEYAGSDTGHGQGAPSPLTGVWEIAAHGGRVC